MTARPSGQSACDGAGQRTGGARGLSAPGARSAARRRRPPDTCVTIDTLRADHCSPIATTARDAASSVVPARPPARPCMRRATTRPRTRRFTGLPRSGTACEERTCSGREPHACGTLRGRLSHWGHRPLVRPRRRSASTGLARYDDTFSGRDPRMAQGIWEGHVVDTPSTVARTKPARAPWSGSRPTLLERGVRRPGAFLLWVHLSSHSPTPSPHPRALSLRAPEVLAGEMRLRRRDPLADAEVGACSTRGRGGPAGRAR